jgi:hypothetical protein
MIEQSRVLAEGFVPAIVYWPFHLNATATASDLQADVTERTWVLAKMTRVPTRNNGWGPMG